MTALTPTSESLARDELLIVHMTVEHGQLVRHRGCLPGSAVERAVRALCAAGLYVERRPGVYAATRRP